MQLRGASRASGEADTAGLASLRPAVWRRQRARAWSRRGGAHSPAPSHRRIKAGGLHEVSIKPAQPLRCARQLLRQCRAGGRAGAGWAQRLGFPRPEHPPHRRTCSAAIVGSSSPAARRVACTMCPAASRRAVTREPMNPAAPAGVRPGGCRSAAADARRRRSRRLGRRGPARRVAIAAPHPSRRRWSPPPGAPPHTVACAVAFRRARPAHGSPPWLRRFVGVLDCVN